MKTVALVPLGDLSRKSARTQEWEAADYSF